MPSVCSPQQIACEPVLQSVYAITAAIRMFSGSMLLQTSMNHVTTARELLSQSNESSLRYAALELRMAIEQLFYRLLPLYREELPDELLKQWQPKRIIDALIDCNPDVERDFTLTLREELPGGKQGQAVLVGRHKAVNRKLLRQYYHKLGSHLHASLNGQHCESQHTRDFLDAAAARIEQFCRETTVFSNIATFHSVQCVCGRLIKRNDRAVKVKPFVKCPDGKCGAEFDLVKNGERVAEWKLRKTEFVCPQCKTSNFFGSHLIDTGASFACVECDQRYVVSTGLFVQKANSQSSTAPTA